MARMVKKRVLNAPIESVFRVLEDQPNIPDQNRGVKESHSTNDISGGVGAQRHCSLVPLGGLEETLVEVESPTRFVLTVDSVSGMPMKRGKTTFNLQQIDGGCQIEVEYNYSTKYGPIGWISLPFMALMLSTGFNKFLKDLEAAAQTEQYQQRKKNTKTEPKNKIAKKTESLLDFLIKRYSKNHLYWRSQAY